MKYTTIEAIAKDMQSELQDVSDKYYELYVFHIIKGIQDLNMFHSRAVKTIEFVPDDTNGIFLPPDFISVVAVGMNLCGRFWTILQNDSILPSTELQCGIPIRDVANGCCESIGGNPPAVPLPTITTPFVGYWIGDQWFPQTYGVGAGFRGLSYKYFERENRINFQGTFPKNKGILQYFTDGVEMCGQTLVPVLASDAIRMFAHYRVKLFDDMTPDNTKERFKREYYEAISKYENVEWGVTYEEYLQGFLEDYKQTMKR